MLDKHEPDEQFVEYLEWQIGSEARRRNRRAPRRSTLGRLLRAAALVLVSIAVGAAAMGASYQIEESWRRELLVAGLEVRLELAQMRTDVAAEELARVEQQAAIGVVGEEDLAQMRMYLLETEAQARTTELELEEIRVSGREPLGEVSSPLVAGRDFVSERIAVEMELARQRLDLISGELERERRRYELGMVGPQQLEAIGFAVAEYEQRVESLESRLSIRRDFLDQGVTAVEAELLVLVADAEKKEARAARQLEMATSELERARVRVDLGVMDEFATRQLELMLAELEAEERLAQVELEVLRRELRERHPGR